MKMSDVKIEHRVESYFSSLNSMANRIMVEKEWAKKGVDLNVWTKMSEDDQTRFLSDSLISPSQSTQIGAKYSYCIHSKPDVDSFPKLDVRSGEKYIVVDEGEQGGGTGTIVRGERGIRRRGSIGSSLTSTWRDEHSGPFTWETQSQLDLTFGNGDSTTEKKKNKNKEEVRNVKMVAKPSLLSDSFDVYRTTTTKKMEKQMNGKCFDKPRPPPPPPTSNNNNKQSNKVNQMKCPPPKPPPKGTASNATMMMNELESVVRNKFDSGDNDKKKQKNRVSSSNKEGPLSNSNEVVVHKQMKPKKSEPAPKSEAEKRLSTSMNDLTLSVDLSPGEDSDIPKTGFDFLDNW